MLRRSSHIAIRVRPEQLEAAVAHYKAALGVVEKSRTDGEVELTGDNFTLWVGSDALGSGAIHEFLCNDSTEARGRIESAGGVVIGESPHGFYVRDPYGLNYHVFVEEDVEA
ncbi:MAG: hypothetical protein JSS66_10135 [Armatimonadetes bacterium]|nr:hypothetical protein [Armatimonadota bacterium]